MSELGFGSQLGLTVANGFINSLGSLLGLKSQVKAQKDLMDYQWSNFLSPSAQVKSMAAAGVNPAAAFAKDAPVLNSAPSAGGVDAPLIGVGEQGLLNVANYIKALSDAKKNTSDTSRIEAETDLTIAKKQALEIETDLRRKYGNLKEFNEVGLLVSNILSANAQRNVAVADTELKRWQSVKEKMLGSVEDSKRKLLEEDLKHYEQRFNLEKGESLARLEASKASAVASMASAGLSRQQTKTEEFRTNLANIESDVYSSKKTYQIAAEIERLKKEKVISEKDAQEAYRRLTYIRQINVDRDSHDWYRNVEDLFDYLGERLQQFNPLQGLAK